MGYIIFLAVLITAGYALQFKKAKAVKFLTLLCFFQNIVLVLCSRFLNQTTFTLLALVKEIYVVFYIALYVITRKKLDREAVGCGISILTLLVCMLLYGQGEMKGMLTSFRQLYLPFLFYMFGSCCRLEEKDCVDIAKFYLKCCVVACLFGIIELVLSSSLWNVLGLPDYGKLKGIGASRMRNGLFKNFYTFDFLGMQIRRMASVLVDPVILGQLLSLGLILAAFVPRLFRNKREKIVTIAMLTCCLLLTLAKGGIVIAIFSVCILLGKVSKKKELSYLLFFIAGIAVLGFTAYSITEELSGSAHLNGLVTGVQSLLSHPFGTGIGSAGNMADAYGGYVGNTVAGDESYIGSLVAQIGWIGIVLNVWFWKRFFYKEAGRSTGIDLVNIINIANIALLLTSFVNYTAISFTSCFMFLILGSASKNIRKGYQKCALRTLL